MTGWAKTDARLTTDNSYAHCRSVTIPAFKVLYLSEEQNYCIDTLYFFQTIWDRTTVISVNR